jgi:hypothetical protein
LDISAGVTLKQSDKMRLRLQADVFNLTNRLTSSILPACFPAPR